MSVKYVKQLFPGTGIWRAGLVKKKMVLLPGASTGIEATMVVKREVCGM
jgi:hypothetical protein